MTAPPPPTLVARLRAAGCVFAEEEAALLASAAADPVELEAMAGRRAAGEPLELVLGWAQFCGLRIAVAPGVFVPRRRTGALVREAAARIGPGTVVVDLCCGSGALGAALAAAVPGIELYAGDVDPVAVACARRNLRGAAATVVEGDLFDALPTALRGRVDAVVANVPYVPTAELPLLPAEARDHEPRRALDGGPDGLDVLRRVAAAAPSWLARGGSLLSETAQRQAARAADVLAAAGLLPRLVDDENLGATVVVGTLPR